MLNEALRAQLMQLEAQKYRIATDIRITFYDALAAQQRVNLIRDFQSVADKGVDIAEQLKEAQEGSQLEIVQAKVQKNEIDLALRQAQIRFDAAWREMAALAGNPDMMPVALLGDTAQRGFRLGLAQRCGHDDRIEPRSAGRAGPNQSSQSQPLPPTGSADSEPRFATCLWV